MGKEAVTNEGEREHAAEGAAGAAAPPVQQLSLSRRRAKHPMSPAEACEIISNAWRRRLEREHRLLEELKEAATLLRNEAACVVQSCFRGFLLRKALGEELQTTVIRWKNPPPGKRHEAEVSIPDPPKWTKKIPMHFCPVRQTYVCPVPVVKGRLLVRLLVDDKAVPLQPFTTEGEDPAARPGVLLLPGSSLRDRIAPQYPWKAARQWLQQQQLQHEQRLQLQELPETQEQLKEQQLKLQEQQEASIPGQAAQHFLEKGELEAPMRPPRRLGPGLLGSGAAQEDAWSSSQYESNVYSWGAPCRPPWSPNSSSSEERELSPLQRRPSWASGARLNKGRPARLPPRWRQYEQQQQQQQDREQDGQGQQRQQQQQQQHSQQQGCSQHQHERMPTPSSNSNSSATWSEAENAGSLYSPTNSSGEPTAAAAAAAAAGAAATSKTTAATAATASVAVSTSCVDASRGLCSPELPTAPSYWAVCHSIDSPRALSPTEEISVTPMSTSVSQQQRWEQPQHKFSLSPPEAQSKDILKTPCKETNWPPRIDEDYPWRTFLRHLVKKQTGPQG
ncbi:LOW QUALITY PROTEIN: uncharacterized protein EMH_0047140 [Eimeria mitis]|uniref:IQ calmodulin-binding motif domain-containing protein n=1 Tax=Eimeria mitis TaxID=44415 RepID=U6JYK5_9EIME|nr:LOW QUALITY PROTEIN: uncharacterized protein EMH_0047140 [Eimeria mitis]CDJ29137.1 hypothetical protein, conserved [Eimeria mitis]